MQNDNHEVVVGSFETKHRSVGQLGFWLKQNRLVGLGLIMVLVVFLGGGAYGLKSALFTKSTPYTPIKTENSISTTTKNISPASEVTSKSSASSSQQVSTNSVSTNKRSTTKATTTVNKNTQQISQASSSTSVPITSPSSTPTSGEGNSGSSDGSGGSTTPTSPMPQGMSGSWNMVFDDEFNGTSLNTSAWSTHNGWTNQNNVTDYSSNISVSGGYAILTLASSSSGAAMETSNYSLPVGGFAEARIEFPGNGTTIYNWPAWWISGPNWPAAGENDIAEGLGTLTVTYHSPSGAYGQGTVPGTWSNGFHTYGIYRGSNYCDVYYDGKLVKTYSTDDNGQPESLIVTAGSGNTPVYGTASEVKVDYVRAWQ